MPVLTIGPEERARILQVVEYAHDPLHIYVPEQGGMAPGMDPRHVVMLGQYRVVYSITYSRQKYWRHLSVSSPNRHRGGLPAPEVVCMTLRAFGFENVPMTFQDASDIPKGLNIGVNEDDMAIGAVLQIDVGNGGAAALQEKLHPVMLAVAPKPRAEA